MNWKVFKMNDFDWVISPLSREETNEWYKKDLKIDDEDQPVDDVEECSEDGGFWSECDLSNIVDAIEHAKPDEEIKVKHTHGYWIWTTFKDMIETYKDRDITEPDYICSTEV
jgi:hypothetical protein